MSLLLRKDSTYGQNPRGHVWQLDSDGEIDDLAYEYEDESQGHNGPRCTVCGYGFCHHCEAEPDHDYPGKVIT